MKALESKYAARAVARARLNYCAEAVERAKRLEATAADHYHVLEQRAAQAEYAQATELAALIASRGPSTELPTAVDEDLAKALATARRDVSFKAQALASLEVARFDAQTELTVADRAVVTAVDALLNEEREEIAAQIERLYGQVARLVGELRETTPDPLHTPVNVSISLSPTVERALSRVPPRDDTQVPVNILRADTSLQLGAVAGREPWAARRARLITGVITEEATTA
jgi:hypothetical protein